MIGLSKKHDRLDFGDDACDLGIQTGGAAEQRAHLHRIEGALVRVRQDDLILIGDDTAPGSRRRRFEINRVLRRPGDRSPFGQDALGRGLIGEADLRLELRHIGDLAHSGKRIAQTVERTELENSRPA